MKITSASDIKTAFQKFNPSPAGASATGRLIQGADSAFDPQEWSERGVIDGKEATVFYLFTAQEASAEEADQYPWDADHIHCIEIED
jgi:hypothetical protein